MDFAAINWDVETEADQLTDSLFGSQPQESKKSRKRKLQNQEEIPKRKLKLSKNKSGDENNELKDDNTAVEHIQTTSHENRSKKKRKRKKEIHGQDTQNNILSQDLENQDFITNVPKKDIKGKKGKNKAIQGETIQTVEMTKLKKQSNKSEIVKVVKKKEKNVANETPVETEGLYKDKNDIVNIKKNKMTLPVCETEEANLDRKKKKRKRKCKKNKFKDYSLEENTNTEETKVVNSQTLKPNVKEIDNNKGIQEKQQVLDGSHAKGKKKQKAANVLKKSPQSATKDKSSKSKLPFDPKTLSAILSTKADDEDSESVANADEQQTKEDSKTEKALKQQTKEVPKSFLEKSRERLNAARFRYLNEQMYTTTGHEAFDMFSNDGQAFQVYHEGFQGQVEKWPTNPIDLIIDYVKSRPKHMLVADFGCGDAKLARSVKNKVFSFDLVALNDHVTVCDMSKVPLKDTSVDIVVFCLSLMGTNLAAYLCEAHRVLRQGGVLKVAEVASRFHSVGSFILKVEKMGFKVINQDTKNKMFVLMDFRKIAATKVKATEEISLKPCLYKKR